MTPFVIKRLLQQGEFFVVVVVVVVVVVLVIASVQVLKPASKPGYPNIL